MVWILVELSFSITCFVAIATLLHYRSSMKEKQEWFNENYNKFGLVLHFQLQFIIFPLTDNSVTAEGNLNHTAEQSLCKPIFLAPLPTVAC